MARKELICHQCKNYFPREMLTQFSKTKRMCPECLRTHGEELKYYKILKDYMCQIRNVDKPVAYDLKQIEELRKDGYTSQSIGYTLNYMLTLKGIKMDKYTVKNVRWYYHEAKEYAERQAKIQEERAQKQFIPKEDRTLKEKVVNTNIGKHCGKKRNTRWTDLSKLGGKDNE